MSAFRLVIWALMALGQLAAWLCWSRRLKKPLARSAVKTVYILFNFVTAMAIGQIYFLKLIPPEHLVWTYIYRPALTWHFGHVMWLSVAAIIWLVAVTLRPWLNRPEKGLPRLFRNKRGGVKVFHFVFLAWLLTMGLVYYSYGVQLGPAEVRRITVSSPDLPPELEGLRIAHLSDLHYGLGTDLVELDRRLTQTAALRPDLVIITGDLLDTKASLAQDWREPLRKLSQVRLGVYGVLGNHDLYTEAPAEEAQIFDSLGCRILRDEAVNLPNAPITLIGFDDPGTRSQFFLTDPDADLLSFQAIAGLPAPAGHYVIVIRHRPQGLAAIAQAGANLYLAGHTHGGQFQVPWNPDWNLMTLSTPHTQGTYYLTPTTLIISNGLSSAGLPFRLWAWPEIGLITLTRGLPQEDN
ncbi:MAG: metallophosphoesterase [Deltaproteobacteria bacterium]|jgi:predicted MPP superfamily phosphohydrolase|nr:metallophosphoesterase [Deltaproteobacteria bacterium]